MKPRRHPPRPRAPRRARLLPWALVLLAGCASQALPPAEPASSLAEQALRQTRGMYLYPEHIDSRLMIGALEMLEKSLDPVRFEPEGASGTLYVGDTSVEVPLEDDPDPERFREVLGQVLAFVRRELGDEAIAEIERDDVTVELLALNGALLALDRYSMIFSGRRTEDFRIRFSGKLHGIGARIGRRDGLLVAVRVFPDSPAERGGLRDGDAIVEIDGEPTRPLDVGQAVQRIRGEAGSVVVLSVRREDAREDLEITRGEVIVPSVEAEQLDDGIGYARIFQVSRSTPLEFRQKVAALGPLDGLVLDLRGNSGGSMMAAAAIADYFLDSGTIVRVVGRDPAENATGRSRVGARHRVEFSYPVAILVDGSTASAAEILSGALEPLPRVTLVGQTTFGKGLVQRVVPIPDEKLLKLTVAEYLLSDDRAINKKGIEPDIRLHPVSSEQPGLLANVPGDAIPYLRTPGEDDTFPVDVAAAVVRQGRASAAHGMRSEAMEQIRAQLAELGIRWREPPAALPRSLPSALEIEGDSLTVVAGKESRIRFRVSNPNPFPVPDAWAALEAPVPFLEGKVVSLGDLGPGETRTGEIRITPPEGIAVAEVPLLVHVASGWRPLQSQRLKLALASRIPEVQIEVERLDADTVRVRVENRGDNHTGEVRVIASSASATLEDLAPGAGESAELALSGAADTVTVALVGPGAQRGIQIPIPEESAPVRVLPPSLALEQAHGLRGSEIRLQASSREGLRHGWIKVDGEKKSYSRWDGSGMGELQASLDSGDASVQAMVETLSGISVLDSRLVTED